MAALALMGFPAPSSAQVHDGWLGGFVGRYALGAEVGHSFGPVAIIARAEGLPADDKVFSSGVMIPAARGAVSAYGVQLAGGLRCSSTSLSGTARDCPSPWSVVGSTSVGVDFEVGSVLSVFAEGGIMYGERRSSRLIGSLGVRFSLSQGAGWEPASGRGRQGRSASPR